ncbi:hypothetical protein RRG08_022084 [Elysia crispata]|uniref:Uncharacterized protein n=1 Tax=Elysia crispata TaxID=231223 RepID=A0AAE1CRK9_9GAST|nr:hypothetical protein RRG08_022084 [Elysia crispata]
MKVFCLIIALRRAERPLKRFIVISVGFSSHATTVTSDSSHSCVTKLSWVSEMRTFNNAASAIAAITLPARAKQEVVLKGTSLSHLIESEPAWVNTVLGRKSKLVCCKRIVNKIPVRAITDLPQSTCLTQFRHFLEMVQYLSRYMPNLTDDQHPIQSLTKKGCSLCEV